MSYRAFKHLLGETSLERKCRFLLGAGIVVLITGSFWWFAFQTEHLAYNQNLTTGRLLINPLVAEPHVDIAPKDTGGDSEWHKTQKALKEFQRKVEKDYPQTVSQYGFIKPKPRVSKHEPKDRFDRQILEEFMEDENKFEASRKAEETRQGAET